MCWMQVKTEIKVVSVFTRWITTCSFIEKSMYQIQVQLVSMLWWNTTEIYIINLHRLIYIWIYGIDESNKQNVLLPESFDSLAQWKLWSAF